MHVHSMAVGRNLSIQHDWNITLTTRMQVSTRKYAKFAQRPSRRSMLLRSIDKSTSNDPKIASNVKFVDIIWVTWRLISDTGKIMIQSRWKTPVTTAGKYHRISMHSKSTFIMFMNVSHPSTAAIVKKASNERGISLIMRHLCIHSKSFIHALFVRELFAINQTCWRIERKCIPINIKSHHTCVMRFKMTILMWKNAK